MIKKDIVKVKAGKGVQKSAEYCGMSVFYKAAEKCAAGNARKREFEHQKRRHQIGNRAGGEQQRDPEKRTPQKIKGLASDKICAEIGKPAPSGLSALNSVMRQGLKWNLLDIVIAVIEEKAAVQYEKRQEDQK